MNLNKTKKVCGRHGLETFNIRPSGSARCVKCQKEDVAKRRLKVKKIMVDRLGGKCSLCGYSKCLKALEFHHTNPSLKNFNLGSKMTWNPEKLWEEVKKCILLCANCHREVEDKLLMAD